MTSHLLTQLQQNFIILHGIWKWIAICETVAKPVARSIASSFFLYLLEKSVENFFEKLSGRSNVFIISKRQSSHSNKFYDSNQTLQAEAISDIVRIDWPDARERVLVLVKQFSFINRNVSLKQILLTWFNIFVFSCLQTEESSQSIYIQQIKWFIQPEVQHTICTVQIHLAWIIHSHDPCLLSVPGFS